MSQRNNRDARANSLRTTARAVLVAAIPVAAAFTANTSRLHAATFTWAGADATTPTDFEISDNWSPLGPPANTLSTDLAAFNALTINQPTLSKSRSITGLLFQNTTGGWNLGSGSSSYVLSIGGSGITTAGGGDTVSANVAVGATQTWQAITGGSLTVSGTISGSTNTVLSFGSAGNAGTIILSGSTNSYTSSSGSSINYGTVQLSGATLGSSLNGLGGLSTGTLDLGGMSIGVGAMSGGETITNTNSSAASILTLGNGNKSGAYSGVITDGTGTVGVVVSTTGSFTFTGAGAQTFSGGMTITGTVRTNGNVNAVGSGTVTLTSGTYHNVPGGTLANPFVITAADDQLLPARCGDDAVRPIHRIGNA